MDLTKLNTKEPQEEGAFCHLRHTKFGHLLYSGPGTDEEGRVVDDQLDHEPIGVMVRGMEAPSVKKVALQIEKDLNPPKATGRKPITEEEAGFRLAEVLVVEFKGLTMDGEPVKASASNIRNFFKMSDNLIEQILEFARSKPNFFEKASTD
jgi:hypothetical protein